MTTIPEGRIEEETLFSHARMCVDEVRGVLK
jgi:hypothetical protein